MHVGFLFIDINVSHSAFLESCFPRCHWSTSTSRSGALNHDSLFFDRNRDSCSFGFYALTNYDFSSLLALFVGDQALFIQPQGLMIAIVQVVECGILLVVVGVTIERYVTRSACSTGGASGACCSTRFASSHR